jgi:anti-sigma regulatory factor (Ser/Thr protein kinase)
MRAQTAVSHTEEYLPELESFSIRLSIASRLDQVRLLRAALSGILAHLRVADEDNDALQLALTEIANNSVEHGYEEATDNDIEVQLTVSGDLVQIELRDSARRFPDEVRHRLTSSPTPIQEPDEQWTMRGHGLQIVSHLVDSIVVDSTDGKNCISMKRHVSVH